MQLKDYIEKAHTTSLNTKINGDIGLYPILGYIDEVGEVAGKVKKLYRDKNGIQDERFKKEISKECGDVSWYLQEIIHAMDLDKDTIVDLFESDIKMDKNPEALFTTIINLARIGTSIFYDYNDTCITKMPVVYVKEFKTLMQVEVVNALLQWVNLCLAFGLDWDVVLQENIDKLYSRKERGVIKGSGDNR